jgi:hypothetical protein
MRNIYLNGMISSVSPASRRGLMNTLHTDCVKIVTPFQGYNYKQL